LLIRKTLSSQKATSKDEAPTLIRGMPLFTTAEVGWVIAASARGATQSASRCCF